MGFIDRIWDSLFGRSAHQSESSNARQARGDDIGVALLDAPTKHGKAADGSSAITESSSGADLDDWWAPPGVSNTEPCWMEPVELIGEARAFESHLVSHFDGHNLAMPPMPHVAERVLKKLRDPKCGMIDVAQVLSEDQVTAADVLRLVNSPLYRGAYKISTLQGAVTRLGTHVLRTLMLHQSLRAVTFPKNPDAQGLAQLIWRRSLASACVMRELSLLVELDAEDSFMLGLLHDIGNVLVLRIVCDQELISHRWLDEQTFEYVCYETHQEFGELVADKWQLPDSIKAIVASHHTLPMDDDPFARQRRLTIVSDMICQMLGFGPPRQYDLLATEAVQALGLDAQSDFHRVLATLPEKIEETISHIG